MAIWDPTKGRYLTYDEAVQSGLIGPGSPTGNQPRNEYDAGVFQYQNPPAPALPAPPTAGLTAEQQSAKALITSNLDSFGLAPLGEWMWQEYMNGVPLDAIWLEMRSRDEYKARFPGMAELQTKGRAISEAQYIDLERQYTQILHANGIPSGIFDQPDQLGKLIGGETSPKEFEDRMNLYSNVAAEFAAMPENRPILDQLQRLYGVHENSGDFLAWVIDPNRTMPILQQELQAGRLSSFANRSGFGNLSRSEAENLYQFDITPDQAQQGFKQLYDMRELVTPIIGEQGGTLSRTEQLNSVFGADNAALERIKRRAEQRKAAFSGGGSFAAGQQGISGLGAAS
jgi:hypothetical protein